MSTNNNILIAIPVYNEEKIVGANMQLLSQFVSSQFPDKEIQILIANNNSSDGTRSIAERLADEYSNISFIDVPEQGKGNAVFSAWKEMHDNFDTFIFMDADLATDIKDIQSLIRGIEEGNDIVIGSRYHPEANLDRALSKRFVSRGYRLLARILLGTQVRDLPCGFKAVNKRVVFEIVPRVVNRAWFFDSELVLLAEKQGYRISEIPVSWKEPRENEDKSKVNIASVSLQYLSELLRMRKS